MIFSQYYTTPASVCRLRGPVQFVEALSLCDPRCVKLGPRSTHSYVMS